MKQTDVLQVVALLSFLSLVSAVPVKRVKREVFSGNSSFQDNECVSEDVVYRAGDHVPSPGPCEQCVCRPPDIQCTMIKCKANSGCRMIQRANHCCPDFMCDCEYKGRTFNNGERLELEDTACQVCYCKGGEIMCTSITCYERTDCQPRYVPGQCCPKYDHCPLETSVNNSANSTVVGSKREIQPWLMTKPVTVKPIEVAKQTTIKPHDQHTPPHVYPQTLKIHEILPTTTKYDRPNGKRPALSTASKVPEEIYLDEKSNAAVQTSTIINSDIGSTEANKRDDEDEKYSTRSQSSVGPTEKPKLTPENESTEEVISAGNSEGDAVVMDTIAPVEYNMDSSGDETSTQASEPKLDYDIFMQNSSLSQDKGNLALEEMPNKKEELAGITAEWDERITTERMTVSTAYALPSTESVRIRSVPSETEPTNSVTLDEGSTVLPDSSMTTYDLDETIRPTLTSDAYKMEPLILSGGVYDELNDTLLYTDDNDVKLDGTTTSDQSYELSSTTYMPLSISSEKESSSSALSQVFEKFLELPRSSVSSVRRNDDWFSKNFKYIPVEGSEESAEKLPDLNFGATSDGATRVSPAYIFNTDLKENNLLSGRSLAPYEERIKNSIPDKPTSETKSVFDFNEIATELPSSQDFSSESVEEKSIPFKSQEQPDLYLSITGKNASSNETILHMVLSPKDLKNLAEQIIKENIDKSESNLKGTEVKIEWLTQHQLSKFKSASSRVSIDLSKSNFIGLADLDLKYAKLKDNDEFKNAEMTSVIPDNSDDLRTTDVNDAEFSTMEYGTSEAISESSTTSYSLTGETTDRSDSLEMEYKSEHDDDEGNSKKNNVFSGPESSTIKIYELHQSDGSFNEKSMDFLVTTDGPYTSNKFISTSVDTTSPQFDGIKKSDSTGASETSTDTDEELKTTIRYDLIEKSRKKNLPNVEPFLRQLPSTLDEKDVSILRDFLEKHLSEPPSR